MSAISRPFKVLGIQQIAIGGPDKVKLQKLWVDMFGLEVTGTYRSDRENVDEDICTLGAGPFKVEVDLMQPLDPDKKPAVHTTPLNHVGLWIDHLPEAVAWLERGGVLAYANVRGSGAFGDAWHRAGFKASKPNTWRDFIAAAEALIDKGYTSKDRLAGSGTTRSAMRWPPDRKVSPTSSTLAISVRSLPASSASA